MKNDYEWGFTDPADFLSHHGIQGMHWGQRNGPPYPLSRTGKWSSGERKAGAIKKVKETAGGIIEAGKKKVSSIRSTAKRRALSRSTTRGTGGYEGTYESKKTKAQKNKASRYAKKHGLQEMDLDKLYYGHGQQYSKDVTTAEQQKLSRNKEKDPEGTKKYLKMLNDIDKSRTEDQKVNRENAEKYMKSLSDDDPKYWETMYQLAPGHKDNPKRDENTGLYKLSSRDKKMAKQAASRTITRGTEPSPQEEHVETQEERDRRAKSEWNTVHNKPVSLMSNEELAAANNRLWQERALKENRMASMNIGKKFLYDTGVSIRNRVIIPQITNYAGYLSNEFLGTITSEPWPEPGSKDSRNKAATKYYSDNPQNNGGGGNKNKNKGGGG